MIRTLAEGVFIELTLVFCYLISSLLLSRRSVIDPLLKDLTYGTHQSLSILTAISALPPQSSLAAALLIGPSEHHPRVPREGTHDHADAVVGGLHPAVSHVDQVEGQGHP